MKFKSQKSIQEERQRNENLSEIIDFFFYGIKEKNAELEQLAWVEWKALEVTRQKDRLNMLIPEKLPEIKKKNKI